MMRIPMRAFPTASPSPPCSDKVPFGDQDLRGDWNAPWRRVAKPTQKAESCAEICLYENSSHTNDHNHLTAMRLTVRVPDDVGETVKSMTDNVSAYVTEALREKVERDRRKQARQNILDGIRDYDGPGVEEEVEEQLHRERRESDRASS